MSKSAGTLITTQNATYIHPRFMPGYTGYVPTIKFDQGETYGNLTCKYFHDFRLKGLESSKLNQNRGGYFPSIYSSDGNLACEARGRSWERWAQMPVYRLTIQDRAALKKKTILLQRLMAHREYYKDRTGTVPKVDYFTIPKNYETREMFAVKPKFSVTCTHPGVIW